MSIARNIKGGGQIFFCPGCKRAHGVKMHGCKARWTYNGNPEAPTFSPSIDLAGVLPAPETIQYRQEAISLIQKDMQVFGDALRAKFRLLGAIAGEPDFARKVRESLRWEGGKLI